MFKLIFSSKEEAKACVKAYKMHLMNKYYKKGIDKDKGYAEYENLYYNPQPQVSFTVMDQYTGYVKAVVGGRGKKNVSLSLNRATDSTRQPGSTFKILSAYAPAIDTMGYTLSTTIVDEPFSYSNGRAVKNWYSGYRGKVTVRKAIADSMNICAVKTLTDITPQLGYDYLCNFGITTLVDNRVEKNGSVSSDIQQALALGGITDGVTNLEMTAAYATIANQGTYTRPVFYSQVIDSNGRVLLDNTTPTTHTVLKASTASLLTQGMTSVITEGTGTSAKLDGKMPVSGKTGTTSSEYDLWFCGYTPYLTASIWTGYDENVSLSGDQAYHERLWAKIMNQIDSVKKYKAKSFKMLRNMISALLQEKLQLKEFVLHQNQSILPRVHNLQNVLIIQLFQKRVQAIRTVQVHLETIVRLEVQAAQAPAIQSQVLIVQNQVQVEPIQEVLEQANQVQDHQVLRAPVKL